MNEQTLTEQEVAASQAAALHQQQLAQHQLHQLASFWQNQSQDIEELDNFKNHELPLARIKRIMKSDEDVRMISAEAPVLFAKACEIFILELTLRAWMHTEENKRRTLQRNDLAMAITKTDVFDFLIDIVPRDDIKGKRAGILIQPNQEEVQRAMITPEIQQYYYHLAQQQQALAQQAANEQALGGQGQTAGLDSTLLFYQQQQQSMRMLQQQAQLMQQLHMQQQQMQQHEGDQDDDQGMQDQEQLQQLQHAHLQLQQQQYNQQQDDMHHGQDLQQLAGQDSYNSDLQHEQD